MFDVMIDSASDDTHTVLSKTDRFPDTGRCGFEILLDVISPDGLLNRGEEMPQEVSAMLHTSSVTSVSPTPSNGNTVPGTDEDATTNCDTHTEACSVFRDLDIMDLISETTFRLPTRKWLYFLRNGLGPLTNEERARLRYHRRKVMSKINRRRQRGSLHRR